MDILQVPRGEAVTDYPPALDSRVLDAPVDFQEEPLSKAEEKLVADALCLGADEQFVVELVFRRRHQRKSAASVRPEPRRREVEREKDAELHLSNDAKALGRLRSLIGPLVVAFEQKVLSEFNHLERNKKFVASFFKPTVAAGRQETIANYRALRALYCREGITRPVEEVFDDLREASFLGKPVMVHKQVATKLLFLAMQLNKDSPDLARVIGEGVKSASGFVPRNVANRRVLSNHALGLALDINPERNPHIVEPRVKQLILEITKGKDPEFQEGFDFGTAFVDRSLQQTDSEDERRRRIERIVQIHAIAMRASDILKAWLEETIARESELAAEIKITRSRVAGDKKALASAKTDDGRKSAQKDLEKDEALLSSKETEMSTDPDLKNLRALREAVGNKTLDAWATSGIREISLDLVIALVNQGFTWGDEYDDSKDGMHFDFERDSGGNKIISKKRYRDLNDLVSP